AIGDEMRRLMSLMIGELNASHSGIYPPPSAGINSTGYIGVRFDRAEYETNGKLKIREVLPLSPAEVYGLKVNDYILAVNDHPITSHTNFDELLSYTTDKRVTLTVSSNSTGSGSRKVFIKPVSRDDSKAITYRA